MESLSTDIIGLLLYLLPGFLSAWVFYSFTSYLIPSQFERVVQALIFTLITQAIVNYVEIIALFIGQLWAISSWTRETEIGISTIVAVAVGLLFVYGANTDKFHEWLRACGLTKETSYPSEWYGTFSDNITYIVLHLNDERRLYGWPIEWPSQSDKGHFTIGDASWLVGEKETQLETVKFVLIKAADVRWVEFMEIKTKENDGQETI